MRRLEVFGINLQSQGQLRSAEHAGDVVLLAAMSLLLIAAVPALEWVAAVLGHLGQRSIFIGTRSLFLNDARAEQRVRECLGGLSLERERKQTPFWLTGYGPRTKATNEAGPATRPPRPATPSRCTTCTYSGIGTRLTSALFLSLLVLYLPNPLFLFIFFPLIAWHT